MPIADDQAAIDGTEHLCKRRTCLRSRHSNRTLTCVTRLTLTKEEPCPTVVIIIISSNNNNNGLDRLSAVYEYALDNYWLFCLTAEIDGGAAGGGV